LALPELALSFNLSLLSFAIALDKSPEDLPPSGLSSAKAKSDPLVKGDLTVL